MIIQVQTEQTMHAVAQDRYGSPHVMTPHRRTAADSRTNPGAPTDRGGSLYTSNSSSASSTKNPCRRRDRAVAESERRSRADYSQSSAVGTVNQAAEICEANTVRAVRGPKACIKVRHG
jgi:hypothetical protein